MSKFKKFISKVRNLFPSPLPSKGMTEFNEWSQSIIDVYGFPDNDSIRFALASVIMHSGPTDSTKPKHHFAKVLQTGAAKQIASAVFVELKEKQQRLEAEAKAKHEAEVAAAKEASEAIKAAELAQARENDRAAKLAQA